MTDERGESHTLWRLGWPPREVPLVCSWTQRFVVSESRLETRIGGLVGGEPPAKVC